jgi:hypothetical protein
MFKIHIMPLGLTLVDTQNTQYSRGLFICLLVCEFPTLFSFQMHSSTGPSIVYASSITILHQIMLKRVKTELEDLPLDFPGFNGTPL